MGANLDRSIDCCGVPVVDRAQVPGLTVAVGAGPVGETIFLVVAGWTGGPRIGGHDATSGFTGWILVGVIRICQCFHRRRSDALDLIVGEVASCGRQAVAEVSLSFSATGVVGEGGDGRLSSVEWRVVHGLELTSVGVGSIDERTIRILQLGGLAEGVFLVADGVGLTVRGESFLSLMASIVIAERDRVVVAAFDARQHSSGSVISKRVRVGLAGERAAGMSDVAASQHAAGHVEIVAGDIALLVLLGNASSECVAAEGDDAITRGADGGSGDMVRVLFRDSLSGVVVAVAGDLVFGIL